MCDENRISREGEKTRRRFVRRQSPNEVLGYQAMYDRCVCASDIGLGNHHVEGVIEGDLAAVHRDTGDRQQTVLREIEAGGLGVEHYEPGLAKRRTLRRLAPARHVLAQGLRPR